MNTEVMKEVLSYIDDHICEKIGLTELAEIAQHDVICREQEQPSGTEIILRPDRTIFRERAFSGDMVRTWVDENISKDNSVIVTISGKN